jgi:hypothetical protein
LRSCFYSGGLDNRFTVESPAPFQPHINLIIHRLEVHIAFLKNARPMDTPAVTLLQCAGLRAMEREE